MKGSIISGPIGEEHVDDIVQIVQLATCLFDQARFEQLRFEQLTEVLSV